MTSIVHELSETSVGTRVVCLSCSQIGRILFTQFLPTQVLSGQHIITSAKTFLKHISTRGLKILGNTYLCWCGPNKTVQSPRQNSQRTPKFDRRKNKTIKTKRCLIYKIQTIIFFSTDYIFFGRLENFFVFSAIDMHCDNSHGSSEMDFGYHPRTSTRRST